MIGTVENGMLVRTWGIQRDVTEKVKLEESRRKKVDEDLRRTVSQLCSKLTAELRSQQRRNSPKEKLYLEHAIDTEGAGLRRKLSGVARH